MKRKFGFILITIVLLTICGCKKKEDFKDEMNYMFESLIENTFNQESFEIIFNYSYTSEYEHSYIIYKNKIYMSTSSSIEYQYINEQNIPILVKCDETCIGTEEVRFKDLKKFYVELISSQYLYSDKYFGKISLIEDSNTIRVYGSEYYKNKDDRLFLDGTIKHDNGRIQSTMSRIRNSAGKISDDRTRFTRVNEVEEFKIPTHTYNGKIIQEF